MNEPSCVKIGSAIFAVGDDKNKKSKEKVQKVTKSLYFTYLSRSPPWTDSSQICRVERDGGHNHVCQFCCL